MNKRSSLGTAFAIALTMLLLPAAPATATPWFNGEYLYRYAFWGLRQQFSPSDDYKMFPYRTIENTPPAYPFPRAASGALPVEVEYKERDSIKRVALDKLLESTATHAFIVIKDGQLLDERYLNGYQRDSVCMSRSIAKSFTSALVGIAIDDGYIKSVDDLIIKYLPELSGRGFDTITIRNLLTMGSGIRYRISELPWDEDALYYFYPNIRNLLLTDMEVAEPPGQTFHYTDYNVGLLTIILERTTHSSVSNYLQEKIWKRIGMEYPATWSLDSCEDGFELTHVALNARAIDYAKFGQLFLDNGNWNGKQIISDRWVHESTAPDLNDHRPWGTYPQWADAGGYYKYFWWGNSRGPGDYNFEAIGRWGQFIFVAPRANVVIVRTAGDLGLDLEQWPQVFQYIADSVSGSGHSSATRQTSAP